MERKHFSSVVWIRAITCLLVVLSHVLPETSLIRAVLYTFHMPLFMSVSGLLFENEVENGPKSKYLTRPWISEYAHFVYKKFKRLIIPFIAIMYLFRKPTAILMGEETLSLSGGLLKAAVSFFSLKTTGPLWFLYVLFLIETIEYVIHSLVRKNKQTLAATGIVRFVLCIIAQLYLRGVIHHLLMYSFYFWLGSVIYHCYGCAVSSHTEINIGLLGIILLLMGLLNCFSSDVSCFVYTVGCSIMASALIITVFSIAAKGENCPVDGRIEKLDRFSMGIYLLHPIIIKITSPAVGKINMCLRIPIMFIISVFGAIVLTMILRKAHLNFILGEKNVKASR